MFLPAPDIPAIPLTHTHAHTHMITLGHFNFLKNKKQLHVVDKLLALWLVHSTLEQAVWVKPWPGILCCVFGENALLSVPLSTQVYKSVLLNLMLGGNPAID